MNSLIGVSIFINAIIVATIGLSGEYPTGLIYFLGTFVIISILGSVVAQLGKTKIGSILIIVGNILFIPIGLIGITGARKLIDKVKEEEFEKRRLNK